MPVIVRAPSAFLLASATDEQKAVVELLKVSAGALINEMRATVQFNLEKKMGLSTDEAKASIVEPAVVFVPSDVDDEGNALFGLEVGGF